MSGFMSNKFLRYAGRLREKAPQVIEGDVPCESCGYNLRGLKTSQRCPECGHTNDIVRGSTISRGSANLDGPADADRSRGSLSDPFRQRRPLIDILGGEGGQIRTTWQFALNIAALCILSALGLRLAYSIGNSIADVPAIDRTYVGVLCAIAVLWNIAIFKTFTPKLDQFWPVMKLPRRITLWTQPLWVLGMFLWFVSTWVDLPILFGAGLLCRLVAGIGVCAAIIVWRQVASDAELNATDRRLNSCLVFLPIATVVGWALMTAFSIQLGGIGQNPESLVLVLGMLPHALGFALWAWMMLWLFSALRTMRNHAYWTGIDIQTKASRPERVAAKREALLEEANAKIRAPRAVNNDEINVD